MYTSPAARAAQAYSRVGAESGVDASTSPHRLIELLFDGLLQAIHAASGALARGDIAAKGQQINRRKAGGPMRPFHSRNVIAAVLAGALLAPAAWAQKRDNVLFQAATDEQPAVIKTLEKLVNIETGTGDAEGIAAAGNFLEGELKNLGFTVTRSKSAGLVVGDNIVGRLKGRGGKNLLLMSHMDTVYLKGTLAKAPFRIEGDKAYGPGIADDKGGNAVIDLRPHARGRPRCRRGSRRRCRRLRALPQEPARHRARTRGRAGRAPAALRHAGAAVRRCATRRGHRRPGPGAGRHRPVPWR